MEKWTRTEFECMQEYLEECAEEFRDRSCNDFTLPNTPDNVEVFTAAFHAFKHEFEDDDEPELEDFIFEGDELYIFDNWLLGYFAIRCKAVLSGTDSAMPLTTAEWHVLSEALHFAYEVREDLARRMSFDATFRATAENKAMIAATLREISPVIRGYTDSAQREPAVEMVAAAAAAIRSSNKETDEVDLPSYWLLYFFSRKCVRQSQALFNSGAKHAELRL